MEQNHLLEVCADSFASACAAVRGGARRIELCSGLVIGGLTPSVGLLERIKQELDVTVNVLIRPRFGDFLYTDEEVEIMRRDIALLRGHGADGFVIGCLNADGDLDEEKTGVLAREARGKNLTLHRAFDVARDPFATLEAAARLGFDTVLTSGQQASAWQGRELIGRLLERSAGLNILIGGGVDAGLIEKMRALYPAACQFHMSGKVEHESGMRFRNENVNMGLPGFSEFVVWQTDEEKVRAAAKLLYGRTGEAQG